MTVCMRACTRADVASSPGMSYIYVSDTILETMIHRYVL